jgi:hypothetical protein
LEFILYFLFFLCLFLGVNYALSKAAGWHSLKKYYESPDPFQGKTFNFITGKLGATYYRSSLIIGLNEQYLFLGVSFPFNFSSPNLQIPIQDIEIKVVKTGLFGSVLFKFKKYDKVVLKVSHRTVVKLEKSSGVTFM